MDDEVMTAIRAIRSRSMRVRISTPQALIARMREISTLEWQDSQGLAILRRKNPTPYIELIVRWRTY